MLVPSGCSPKILKNDELTLSNQKRGKNVMTNTTETAVKFISAGVRK
jgi:hypothetical protein